MIIAYVQVGILNKDVPEAYEMLKEKVDVTATKLGLDKIEPPIFYNCPVGIRFEIGVGSPYLFLTMPSKKYVRTALQRAYTIY